MHKNLYAGFQAILKRHFIGRQALRSGCSFATLGISAEERNELFCDVEQHFGLVLNDAELTHVHTFGQLLRHVTTRLAAG